MACGGNGGSQRPGADLASSSNSDLSQAQPDLTSPGDLFTSTGDLTSGPCVDSDGDGVSVGAGCTGALDCDDDNPNESANCGSCIDSDGDGFFTGCDHYNTVPADCNDNSSAVHQEPELLFDGIDQDCDGVASISLADLAPYGIYVSLSGDDSNTGSAAQPVRTISHALELATATRDSSTSRRPRRYRIYAAAGTYVESVTINNGVSLYGGFDASWVPSGAKTIIQGVDSFALEIQGNLRAPTAIENVELRPPIATTATFGLLVDRGAIRAANMNVTASGALGTTVGIQMDASSLTWSSGTLNLSGYAGSPSNSHFWRGLVLMTSSTLVGLLLTVDIDGGNTQPDKISAVVGIGGTQKIDLTDSSILARGASSELVGISAQGGQLRFDRSTLELNPPAAVAIGMSLYQTTATMVGSTVFVLGRTGPNPAEAEGVNAASGSTVLVNSRVEISGIDKAVAISDPAGPLLVNNRLNGTASTLASNSTGRGAAVGAGARLLNNSLYAYGTGSGHAVLVAPGASDDVVLLHNALSGVCLLHDGTACAADVNACTFAGCLQSEGNLNSMCGGNAEIPIDSDCKGAGIDPASYYATPFVDMHGQSRPIDAWDIGVDEI